MSLVECYILIIAAITYISIGKSMARDAKLRVIDKIVVFMFWPFVLMYWAIIIKLKGE